MIKLIEKINKRNNKKINISKKCLDIKLLKKLFFLSSSFIYCTKIKNSDKEIIDENYYEK